MLGFRIGAFAYLTDCNAIPDVSWPLLADLDVLVLDALRHKAHRTHFTVEQAVGAARRIGARRTFFTHMTHDLPHAATCSALPAGISLAYDGAGAGDRAGRDGSSAAGGLRRGRALLTVAAGVGGAAATRAPPGVEDFDEHHAACVSPQPGPARRGGLECRRMPSPGPPGSLLRPVTTGIDNVMASHVTPGSPGFP